MTIGLRQVWSKTEPFQSIYTHSVLSGVVAQVLVEKMIAPGVQRKLSKNSRMLTVYIYSNRAIDRERLLPGMTLAGQRDLIAWLETMREGQNWRFDLRASPTKKEGESLPDA